MSFRTARPTKSEFQDNQGYTEKPCLKKKKKERKKKKKKKKKKRQLESGIVAATVDRCAPTRSLSRSSS